MAPGPIIETAMLGLAKDTPLKEQFFEFVRRYETYPGQVEERETAPWQEVEIDEEINLFDALPLFRLNHGDGGFYIDKAAIVTRDITDWNNPNTQNVGMYRLQVKGKNRIGDSTGASARHRDSSTKSGGTRRRPAYRYLHRQRPPDQYRRRNADPVQPIRIRNGRRAGTGTISRDNGKPYRFANPWGSEIVLEGKILSRVREAEGPFGEFTGHYSGARRMPVVEITKNLSPTQSHLRTPVSGHAGRKSTI